MRQNESLKPAAPVNARINPTDFAADTRFSGTRNNKNHAVDGMDQYEAFVKVYLKSFVQRET